VEEARTTAAAKAALTVAEERKERAGQMDDLRLKVTPLLGLLFFKVLGMYVASVESILLHLAEEKRTKCELR
jgi:hypothetical protein